MKTITQNILNIISKKRKGAIQSVDYEKQVEDITIKEKLLGRFGIKYHNMKSVKEKIANGYIVSGQLPWGSFLVENYVITHTNKKGDYNEYIRFYPTKPLSKKYYYQGKEISFEMAKQITSESKLKSNPTNCMCLNVNGIKGLNGKSIFN